MKGEDENRYFGWKWFVILGVLAVLIWGVWVLFFSYADCEAWECFNDNLKNCDKTKFIGETDMIFEYIIEGSSDGECEVVVQLLQGELNNKDSIKLEMQKMTCMLPGGIVMIPESDIGNCHGMLKEGLQDLVIKKLHTYLVQNLGKLNLEMLDVPEFESVVGSE
ncbi:MAG: hypothetical protein ABIF18_04030 [archaeon]